MDPRRDVRALDDVAARLADGEAIDWDVLESNAPDQSTRSLIRQLREIASISRAHALHSLDAYLTETHAGAGRQDRAAEDVPATWGGLRILGEIGRGRFGTVYRAWDPALDREVALKLLRSPEVRPVSPTAESPDEALIVHEGRLMARIRHPNVVTIHGAQRIDGRTGIWMELVEGQTLEAELRACGPFPAGEVAAVGIELCRALAAVHAAGLVHRDVKAQNVLREATGRIALGDFGTGRELDDLERERGIAGTPAYLAPEIFRGEPATPRSDLYSLGTLLFLLGTGRFPVQGRTVREIREAHARADRACVRDVRPDLPGLLAGAIDRALSPDPEQRFDSAAAMQHALHAAVPEPESASATLPAVTGVTRARSAKALLAALAVIAVGAATYRSGGVEAPSSPPGFDVDDPVAAIELVDVPEPPAEAIPTAADAATQEPGSPLPTAGEVEEPKPAFRGRSGLVLTQIDPDFSRNIRIYDGVNIRRVTCTVRGRQAVQLCDLEANTITDLRMPEKGERGEIPRLSPDGRHVAYAWHTGPLATLRVVGSDGTDDRELVPPSAQWSYTDIKWMRDQSALVVRRAGDLEGVRQLGYYLVPLDGGAMQPLWVGPASDAWIDISPDGRFIVVDRPGDDGDTDLAIIDVATGQEQPLLTGPASDSNASWTPDGSAVVYLSNSAGVRGLYMVRVAEGTIDGAPALLQEFPRGTVTKIGFTSDGALFLERMTHWYNTFRARIDLAAGVTSPPRRLDVRTTNEETPGVSVNPLDGRIAYVAGGFDALAASARVVIMSADGRLPERSLPVAGRAGRKSRVQWSPDGTLVAVSASAGIEVLDVEQGTAAHVIDAADAWDHKWDPGGGAIYYAVDSEIRRYDLQDGNTTTVYSSRARLVVTATFDVSPMDGALLLPTPGAVVIVRAGEPAEFRIVAGLIAALAWTRDGSRILVSSIGSDPAVATLRILDAGEGPPIPVAIDAEPLTDLSLSADGQELFFAAGSQRSGYWVLTGFLQR